MADTLASCWPPYFRPAEDSIEFQDSLAVAQNMDRSLIIDQLILEDLVKGDE